MGVMNVGAQAGVSAALAQKKPVTQTMKVNVATPVRCMHLFYPVLHAFTVDTAYHSFLLAELA